MSAPKPGSNLIASRETSEASRDAAHAQTAELDAHFRTSFRALWLIAVGIVGDAASAEDVVQEAAVVALNKLDQYSAGTNFAAWAGQIVRNIAYNRARWDRRRAAHTHDFENVADKLDPTRPAAFTLAQDRESGLGPDAQEFHGRLLAALTEVAEIPRACLLLRTVEGLSYADISQLLGIPEGTAMSHVHRTRKSLRTTLSAGWTQDSNFPHRD